MEHGLLYKTANQPLSKDDARRPRVADPTAERRRSRSREERRKDREERLDLPVRSWTDASMPPRPRRPSSQYSQPLSIPVPEEHQNYERVDNDGRPKHLSFGQRVAWDTRHSQTGPRPEPAAEDYRGQGALGRNEQRARTSHRDIAELSGETCPVHEQLYVQPSDMANNVYELPGPAPSSVKYPPGPYRRLDHVGIQPTRSSSMANQFPSQPAGPPPPASFPPGEYREVNNVAGRPRGSSHSASHYCPPPAGSRQVAYFPPAAPEGSGSAPGWQALSFATEPLPAPPAVPGESQHVKFPKAPYRRLG